MSVETTGGHWRRARCSGQPPADARERFRIGRYIGVAAYRARARLLRLRGAAALVDRRPRGVLGVDLGLLRGPRACALRAGARLARDAGRGMVPGRATELRRAHGGSRRGHGCRRGRRALADARAHGPHLRRPPGTGRTRPRRPEAARCRARRPRRRVPAEHPGDARRLPRDREPRRDLGDVPARVRRPQRPPTARSARAEGVARRRGLPLRGEARRPQRRRWPRSARAFRAWRPSSTSRYAGHRRRTPGHGLLGRAPRRSRDRSSSSRCRSRIRCTCSSHPARPGCPRRSCTATAASSLEHLKNHALQLGPGPRRPAPVVHDDGVDDVERARLDAAPARVDRDDRRPPRIPRPVVPVAADRGDEADLLRPEPRVHDGLPQGGARARAGLRPLLGPHGLRGGLAASARGIRVAVRAVRARSPGERRQRRHRRVHGARAGIPDRPRVRGRDVGANAGGGR